MNPKVKKVMAWAGLVLTVAAGVFVGTHIVRLVDKKLLSKKAAAPAPATPKA